MRDFIEVVVQARRYVLAFFHTVFRERVQVEPCIASEAFRVIRLVTLRAVRDCAGRACAVRIRVVLKIKRGTGEHALCVVPQIEAADALSALSLCRTLEARCGTGVAAPACVVLIKPIFAARCARIIPSEIFRRIARLALIVSGPVAGQTISMAAHAFKVSKRRIELACFQGRAIRQLGLALPGCKCEILVAGRAAVFVVA